MNKKQENKLSMYFAVEAIVQKHQSVWSGLIAFGDGFQRFQTSVQEIEAKRIMQEMNREGIVKDKEAARVNLMTQALEVSRAVVAYATVGGDLTMAERLRFTVTDFSHGRDTGFLDNGRLVLQEATLLAPFLGNYGVTSQRLGELNAAVQLYEGLVSGPRVGAVEQGQATAELMRLFGVASGILRTELDGLVLQFRGSEFLIEYKRGRKIINS
jgi:hypothetical protein